jgi:hypothetical protein
MAVQSSGTTPDLTQSNAAYHDTTFGTFGAWLAIRRLASDAIDCTGRAGHATRTYHTSMTLPHIGIGGYRPWDCFLPLARVLFFIFHHDSFRLPSH